LEPNAWLITFRNFLTDVLGSAKLIAEIDFDAEFICLPRQRLGQLVHALIAGAPIV
jgi:hypothetical protein